MATRRLPIINWSFVPDSLGEVFWQSYSNIATNDYNYSQILRFGASNVAQPTAWMDGRGGFAVPMDYVGTPVLVLVWTATVTSGAVYWVYASFRVPGNDTTPLTYVAWGENSYFTDNAPTAAHRRLERTQTLVDAYAPGDTVNFVLGRVGNDALDTMPGSAVLFNAYFQYSNA